MVLVVTLLLLCVVLATLGFLQGPKLASAQVDVAAVTTQTGQQLRLFANQAIAEVDASQVSVTPEAPVSVTTSGDVVAVQFDGMLRYGTEYTVRVAGVTGVSPSGSGTLEYRFQTASPDLYYVVPGDESDQVMRSTLGSGDSAVVYAAAGMRSIAVVGQALGVVRDLDDGSSTLELVSLTEGIAETVPLPSPGRITDFAASTVGASVGFSLSGEDRALYVADLGSTRQFTAVEGLSGEPLQVASWAFIPGSTNFVALNTENSVFTADAAAPGPLTPLGQLTELSKVSRDGLTVTGRDALGPVALSLVDGSQRVLEFQPVGDSAGFVGETEILPDGTLLERVAIDTGAGGYRIVVAVDDGTTARIVYDGGGADIRSFAVSPNAQYVALDLDGTATVIVDIASGLVTQTLQGTEFRW